MKLFEHQEAEQALDRLPDLPPDVEVPDDISGLGPPETLKTAERVRWMRWLAAIVLLAGAGVLTAVMLQSDGDETTVDYMETYGTDNPTIVEVGAEPGTVEIVATEDYLAVYGTDNPVFVPGADTAIVVAEDYMAVYGTDNPVLLPEPALMELYGTDNPVFIGETDAVAADYLVLLKEWHDDDTATLQDAGEHLALLKEWHDTDVEP